MNLAKSPTLEQLRSLIASCNDLNGPHILWVDIWDNVHISCLTKDVSPDDWVKEMGNSLKFRYETWVRDGDYVGMEPARCDTWPPKLFKWLLRDHKRGATGCIQE